jgi:hypothetical protein
VPTYARAGQLSDQDISLLREVLNRHRTDAGTNGVLLQKAADKVRGLLSVRDDREARDFLETVIRDYNYLTGRDA